MREIIKRTQSDIHKGPISLKGTGTTQEKIFSNDKEIADIVRAKIEDVFEKALFIKLSSNNKNEWEEFFKSFHVTMSFFLKGLKRRGVKLTSEKAEAFVDSALQIQQETLAKIMDLLGMNIDLGKLAEWLPYVSVRGERQIEEIQNMVNFFEKKGFTLDDMVRIFRENIFVFHNPDTAITAHKNLLEIHGQENAKKVGIKNPTVYASKVIRKAHDTLVEIYGEEKARELGIKNPELYKSKVVKSAYDTLVEIHGEEKAKEVGLISTRIYTNSRSQIFKLAARPKRR